MQEVILLNYFIDADVLVLCARDRHNNSPKVPVVNPSTLTDDSDLTHPKTSFSYT